MDSSETAKRWKDSFGAFAPVGYICRDRIRARWLRIHSLPESKRYPETEAEYRELLRRHNEVATTTLGTGDECVLFAASFDDVELPSLSDAPFVSVPDLSTAGDDDGTWIHVAASMVSWEPGRFDRLIRAVADEQSGPILFANLDRRTAYAPYDGGADLFFDSQDAAAKMRVLWRDWLSTRPDDL